MRRTLIFCFLLLCSTKAISQAYDSAIRFHLSSPSFNQAMDHFIQQAIVDTTLTGEESRPSILERKKLWSGKRISNDVPIGEDMVAPMNLALASYMTHYNDYCPGIGYSGNWKCLGPFNDYYNVTADYPDNCENQGRIDAIWVAPLPDTMTMLAGANGGGLWKTNDGGRSWRNITDGAIGTASSVIGIGGVHGIAVNPSDTNMIYIAAGGPDNAKKTYQYGLGLAYTTDGGVSWHTDDVFNSMVSSTHIPRVTKVAFMPGTQQLFAISEDKILYKASPSHSWTNITPDTIAAGGYWCTDLEFSKATTGTVVVGTSALNGTSNLWCYHSGTWTRLILTLPSPYAQESWQDGHVFSDGVALLSISGDDNAYMGITAHNGAARVTLLVKTPLSGYIPTILNYNFPGVSPSAITDFEVSGNHNIIYATNYLYFGTGSDNYPASLVRSVDEGASFQPFPASGHPDGRCMYIQHSLSIDTGLYDIIYFGNDGGIRKKSAGHMYCHSITGKGLGVTQFFGFGGTEADDGVMMAGGQDVGTHAYRKTAPTPWQNVLLGDGYTAKFAVNGVMKAFGENNATSPHPMFGKTFTPIGITDFEVPTPIDSPISNINRPQYFDPNNSAHVGYSYVWKKRFDPTASNWASGSWQRAFQSDPVFYGLIVPYDKIVVDLHIGEIDTNNVYIAYRDITKDRAGVTRSPLNDTFGKLYHSINAGDVPPTWANITPPICTTNGINSIAVDPNNPARIWVGFGNINNEYIGANPDTMKRRVWYSSNSGATWTEVSKGLSALPVNKLLYRKGSNDELYAGTDAGVFKWNRIACEWECFNNGLPPCTVMDMEFNHCAGKLRIATFGRGIWETPLPIIPPGEDSPIEISSGTTIWDNNMWLQSQVIVKAGAILSISGATIHMPANASIMVEQGAKLLVTNARLTNSCEGCLWGGIQAWGDNTHTQSTAYQGFIRIENSTIEHAKVGVINCNPNPALVNGNGGIIQASGSLFLNNVTAAVFKDYRNLHPVSSVELPDVSYFTNCSFYIDNGYKGTGAWLTPARHISLEGIYGLNIRGCSFNNRHSIYRGTGSGIYAVKSGFSVVPYCYAATTSGCLGTSQRCRFNGLTHGVYIAGAGLPADPTASIDQADFDSVSIGVYVSAQRHVSVTRCNMNIGRGVIAPFVGVGGAPLGCGRNIGVFTQNSPVFRIEENTFTGLTNSFAITPWYNAGVLAANAGNATNRVYRNTFTGLSYGVLGLGNNATGYPSLSGYGLQVSCNSFSSNTNDIYAGGTGGMNGIGLDQRGPTYYGEAGNTFSGSVKNIVNTNPLYTIYYSRYGTGSISTSGLVTIYSGAAEACASTIPPPVTRHPSYMSAPPTALDETMLDDYKAAYYTARNNRTTALAAYNAAIDRGGKTDSLLTFIDTCANMDTFFRVLNDISPFLSQTVLNSAASTAAGHNYAEVLTLLALNPEVIRDYSFLSALATRISMSNEDFETLVTESETNTDRGTLEQNVAMAQAAMDENVNIILMALRSPIDTNVSVLDTTHAGICMDTSSVYYLVDTNSYYRSLDTVEQWLKYVGTPNATYERVGIMYLRGELQDAITLFNSIDSSRMTPSEKEEYIDYYKTGAALYSAATDGRGIFTLNETEISLLDTSGDFEFTSNAARIAAWNLKVNPIVHFPCASLPPVARAGSTPQHPPFSAEASRFQRVKVYPNPSAGTVTFEYNLPSVPNEKVTITVLNMLGEKVMEQEANGNTGKILWQPGALASGMYIYQVTGSRGIAGKGKLVLTR